MHLGLTLRRNIRDLFLDDPRQELERLESYPFSQSEATLLLSQLQDIYYCSKRKYRGYVIKTLLVLGDRDVRFKDIAEYLQSQERNLKYRH